MKNEVPEIYIKAINPGYTIDGKSNVGEMVEIGRRDSGAPISLAGLTVGYTNSSGNYTVLVEFPENSYLVGETILLRLASSPEHELAALNYTKTLAFKAGPLVLKWGEEIIDEVCWNGKDNCAEVFNSSRLTTLVRNMETGDFEHLMNYRPEYHPEDFLWIANEDESDKPESRCKGLIFSEILSYYEESQAEQFVELYNTMPEQILMNGCSIRYKNKLYPLEGILRPESYHARYLVDFSIAKNPTNFNTLEIVDVNGEIVDRVDYPNGQKKATSYALIGYDDGGKAVWRTTYAPTPGEANHYQEFKTCEEGKVINEATGNCVNVAKVEPKTCPAGQFLNPLTGRCNKIKSVAAKTCKEGYVLNEETGRCKKIIENTGANYNLGTETYNENSIFVAVGAISLVVAVGVIYVVWEFRQEIRKFWRKVRRR